MLLAVLAVLVLVVGLVLVLTALSPLEPDLAPLQARWCPGAGVLGWGGERPDQRCPAAADCALIKLLARAVSSWPRWRC